MHFQNNQVRCRVHQSRVLIHHEPGNGPGKENNMKYTVEHDCLGLGSGYEVVQRPSGYIMDTFRGKNAERRAERCAASMNSAIDKEDRS